VPAYNYRCIHDTCGTRWSETRKMDERHTAHCPQCGGAAVITIRVAPHLKWYPGTTRGNFYEPKRSPE